MNKKLILSAVLLAVSSIKADCQTACCPDMRTMNPDEYTIAFSVKMLPGCCQETRDAVKGIVCNCMEECRNCATVTEQVDSCCKAAKACCDMKSGEVAVEGTILAQEAKPAEAQAEVVQEEVPAQEAA